MNTVDEFGFSDNVPADERLNVCIVEVGIGSQFDFEAVDQLVTFITQWKINRLGTGEEGANKNKQFEKAFDNLHSIFV